jgi:hypothetical protein
VVAVAIAAALVGPAAVSSAAPTDPAFAAQTDVSIKRADHRGYVNVYFTVTRNVQGTDYPTQLIVSVQNCVVGTGHEVTLGPVGVGPGDCTDGGHTVTALGPANFTMSSSLRQARLRTTWLGKALTIQWNAARVPAVHSNVDIDAGFASYVMLDESARRSTAVTRLLGQKGPCAPWPLASLETAAHGALLPAVVQHPTSTNPSDLSDLRSARIDCA